MNNEEIEDIKLALENVRKGKVKPTGEVARELGIALMDNCITYVTFICNCTDRELQKT
ncbi:hypothetical protein HYV50_03945 [Candidatus Pacearchaeota archaeon]|nr:hypothetical protein [Candidatus Pacearchaeota archaeon]